MTNIAAALMKAQQEFPPIIKDKQGYNYKYAGLEQLLTKLLPVLRKHGILMLQDFRLAANSDTQLICTRLLHVESGEEMISDCTIKLDDDPQVFGSRITYMKRYMISALLGIEAEEDEDGAEYKKKQKAAPTGTQKPQSPSVGTDPGKHKITGGKFGGMTIAQASDAAGIFEFNGYVEWCAEQKNQSQNMLDFLANAEAFLKSRETKNVPGKN